MATASKAFRARAFDANKSLAIYWSHELPDLSECAAGNRAVTQMPTGMEKEEEMESHLQDAILAQQASTSGVQVNHVIPTPKVWPVEHERYDKTYPSSNKIGKNKYIKVHAWQALERDEPEYDYDTEDEEWLTDHPHIEAKVFEKIFDTVEANSSESQIASEDSVLNTHKSLDPSIIYEVYEYWLSKRTSYATTSGCVGIGGLIPRVRTECRKDAQGAINPYVAFRRRAEKMQTRKNRKNDEDNYEKILKLVHDLSKVQQLMHMTTRREKMKCAIIDYETQILSKRMQASDFGATNNYKQFDEKLNVNNSILTTPLSPINGSCALLDDEPKKRKNKKIKGSDGGIVSKAWLKKNAESWNRPPSLFGRSNVKASPATDKPKTDAYADGRYTFKRRRGCTYRAALPVFPVHTQQPQSSQSSTQKEPEIPAHLRFYETFLPSTNGNFRSIGFARRRIGRGGRVIFDRISRNQDSRGSWNSDAFIDTSRIYRARMHPFAECDEDEESSTERYFVRSDHTRFDDSEVEREWISKYQPGAWRDKGDKEKVNGGKTVPNNDAGDSEIEKMEVDDGDVGDNHHHQVDEKVSPNGNDREKIEEEDEGEEDNENEMDVVVDKLKHATGGKTLPTQNSIPRSGNGIAGRVEPTPVPAKMCGTVSDSDDWREPSGSPSESNSSTEWNGYGAERVAAAFKSKLMRVEQQDDVRSPVRANDGRSAVVGAVTATTPRSNSIKDSMSTVTILERNNKYILPSTVGI